MKNLNLICALLLLGALASCKKDNTNPDTTPTQPSVPKIAAFSDSVSFTIDGKAYNIGNNNIGADFSDYGGQEINRKLIFPNPNDKNTWSLVGNPDSVMFYQLNQLANKTRDTSVHFYFAKKYHVSKGGLTWMPGLNDILKLFAVGKYPLAEDFGWQNSQNGIAIGLSANGKTYVSNNAYDGVNTVTITPGFQKNSSFEITGFTPVPNRGYNLEAKFSAVVFDSTGQQKKVENGYLRLNFGVWYNTTVN